MQALQAADQQSAALLGSGRRLVSKSEFARLRGITPARISQLIGDGRIHGDAIVGTGPRAQIDANVANQQLGDSLDITQQMAQQRPTAPDGLPLSSDQKRIQAAKAEQAEISARQARREEAAQAGFYVRTEDVRRAWSRELTELLAGIDGWIAEAAGALTRDLGIDQKQATVLLRKEWRAFRTRRSDLAKNAGQDLPTLIEEEPTDNG